MTTPKLPKGARIGERVTFSEDAYICPDGHRHRGRARMGDYFAARHPERIYFVCNEPGCDLTPEPAPDRTGTVIDRAPQGWNPNPGIHADTFELSGYWLWVMPDEPHPEDTGAAVRVRYYSRGQSKGLAYRDDGPMCVTGRLAYGHAAGSRKVTVQELLAEVGG